MAYERLNLKSGDPLKAEHFAHIEDGIVENCELLSKHLEENSVPVVATIEEMTDTEKKYALKTDEYYVYAFGTREPSIIEDIPFEEGIGLTDNGAIRSLSVSSTTDFIPVDVTSEDGVFVGFQLFTNESDGVLRNNSVPMFCLYDGDKNYLFLVFSDTNTPYVVETFNGIQYKGLWLSKDLGANYHGSGVVGAKYVRVSVANNTGDYMFYPHNFITAYKTGWVRDVPEWQSAPAYIPQMASETVAGLVRVWTTTNENGEKVLNISTEG